VTDPNEYEAFLPYKGINPTPIALEPCSSGRAAVLSLIVKLPTGGTGVVPPGQTGLAVASALVSLGSTDHKNSKEGEVVTSANKPAISTKSVGSSAASGL